MTVPTAPPAAELVGRENELARLREALHAPERPVAVVHGEPGIGKTRLVRQFAEFAEQEGFPVLWGACDHDSLGYGYGPWVEALDDRAQRDSAQSSGDHGARAAALARGLSANPSDANERQRLYEAVVTCLDALGPAPVVVLDDLQWADEGTLDLLAHVARFGRDILLVAVHRGTEIDVAHPAGRRLAEIGRRRTCTYIAPARLSSDEAVELIERCVEHRVGPDVLAAIYAESGGNPFFIGELARDLRGHGDPSAPGWRPPVTIRRAIGLRLAELSTSTQAMLQLAAVFDEGFGFAELELVTELDEPLLLDCLDEALAAELLRPVGVDRFDFAQLLVRRSLYTRLAAGRRARVHRRLAEALERSERREFAAEIGRQYRASAALPGASRGVPYALTAAERAVRAGAPAEAVTQLEVALELLPLGKADTRARILGELASALAASGRPAEATLALADALDEHERLGSRGAEVAALVTSVLAVALDGLGSPVDLQPLIRRGLDALGGDRGLSWARLRLLERPTELVPAGPVRVARFRGFDPEAVRVARAHGTPADEASTVEEEAQWPLDRLEAYLARVRGWPDPTTRLRATLLLALNATVGRWAGSGLPAARLCAEVDALSDLTGSPPTRAIAAVLRAALHGSLGEFDAAAAELERAEDRTAVLGRDHRAASLLALVRELTLQHVHPRWSDMGERMYAFACRREPGPWSGQLWAALAANAFARAGLEDPARTLLATITPVLVASGPWDAAQSGAVSFAAEAAWHLQAPELARPLLDCAQALADAGAGAYYMANSELTVARLLTVLDRPRDAEAWFARARAELDARGLLALRAIVDHDEGVARRLANQPGAEPLLAAATERFRVLGMSAWRAGDPRSPARLPDALTPREAEVLRLLAAGRTNKEIAAELVLSVHTIERHLANAYRKLSVRNRADATAYVLRAQL